MTEGPHSAVLALLPLISSLRDETEAQRRIAARVVEALRSSRLCRTALPADLGGLELPPAETFSVYEQLAGAEASVAWIVWNNTLPCYFGRFFAPKVRSEIFGDPQSLYAGSTRPSGRAAVEGGSYRVNGRWSLVSGCELADWLALRCVIEENGQPRMLAPEVPEVRMVWLRRAELEILDTWYTGGLRGTGSHDVVVRNALVPRSHTLSPIDGSTLAGPLGRVPIVSTMAAGYGAQLLGLGQASVDTLTALSRKKPVVDPGPALGQRPAMLAAIAEHGVRLAAARSHLRDRVQKLWDAAVAGSAAPEAIADVFNAAHHAMAQGRAAVTSMYSLAGASALYTSSPLERIHRDMHAMSAHVIAQPMWIEDTGRVLLGAKPVNPLYLI